MKVCSGSECPIKKNNFDLQSSDRYTWDFAMWRHKKFQNYIRDGTKVSGTVLVDIQLLLLLHNCSNIQLLLYMCRHTSLFFNFCAPELIWTSPNRRDLLVKISGKKKQNHTRVLSVMRAKLLRVHKKGKVERRVIYL